MKKRQAKPQQKLPEFATTPFKGLKGVRVAPEGGAPQAPPPPAPPVAEDDDADIFLRSMGGVKRLEPLGDSPATRRAAPLAPRKIEENERKVFLEALDRLQLDVTFVDTIPDEAAPRQLPVNRMRQLRRGAIRIDYELDLHGLSRDEAIDGLAAFVASARKLGQKAVLVITGKGNNSPGEPVLLGAVTAWLRDKGPGVVSEFFPAPRDMGGGGAIVVFLREKDRTAPSPGSADADRTGDQ